MKEVIVLFILILFIVFIFRNNKQEQVRTEQDVIRHKDKILLREKGMTGKHFYRKGKISTIMMIQIKDLNGKTHIRKASPEEKSLIERTKKILIRHESCK